MLDITDEIKTQVQKYLNERPYYFVINVSLVKDIEYIEDFYFCDKQIASEKCDGIYMSAVIKSFIIGDKLFTDQFCIPLIFELNHNHYSVASKQSLRSSDVIQFRLLFLFKEKLSMIKQKLKL